MITNGRYGNGTFETALPASETRVLIYLFQCVVDMALALDALVLGEEVGLIARAGGKGMVPIPTSSLPLSMKSRHDLITASSIIDSSSRCRTQSSWVRCWLSLKYSRARALYFALLVTKVSGTMMTLMNDERDRQSRVPSPLSKTTQKRMRSSTSFTVFQMCVELRTVYTAA